MDKVHIVMYDDWGSTFSPAKPVAAYEDKIDADEYAKTLPGAWVLTLPVTPRKVT